jgi:hypothetical protein
MAGGDEAPKKTPKRAEGHSHILGDGQPKRPSTPWGNTLGRRDSDQAKDWCLAERLCREHWSSGRHPYELGTGSKAAVWACQGAARTAGKETQSGGGDLPPAAAEDAMGTWVSGSEQYDSRGTAGRGWADPSYRHFTNAVSPATGMPGRTKLSSLNGGGKPIGCHFDRITILLTGISGRS